MRANSLSWFLFLVFSVGVNASLQSGAFNVPCYDIGYYYFDYDVEASGVLIPTTVEAFSAFNFEWTFAPGNYSNKLGVIDFANMTQINIDVSKLNNNDRETLLDSLVTAVNNMPMSPLLVILIDFRTREDAYFWFTSTPMTVSTPICTTNPQDGDILLHSLNLMWEASAALNPWQAFDTSNAWIGFCWAAFSFWCAVLIFLVLETAVIIYDKDAVATQRQIIFISGYGVSLLRIPYWAINAVVYREQMNGMLQQGLGHFTFFFGFCAYSFLLISWSRILSADFTNTFFRSKIFIRSVWGMNFFFIAVFFFAPVFGILSAAGDIPGSSIWRLLFSIIALYLVPLCLLLQSIAAAVIGISVFRLLKQLGPLSDKMAVVRKVTIAIMLVILALLFFLVIVILYGLLPVVSQTIILRYVVADIGREFAIILSFFAMVVAIARLPKKVADTLTQVDSGGSKLGTKGDGNGTALDVISSNGT
eukprot:NODE_235_length_1833_cov_58.360492_g210_i0.p1 GENE.NODE_235_length_1833_cov_58.360492_g210_i0~~NODE_235_length_1833_cov_58.360492_g210_i0.p1  ORF type:complete len:527 (-),score=87.87 NODE_235_length_1833_cov_58.360492_g210_i0:252-1679(-)